MTTKCNCGRRTPFAHKHAETCPCFQPQLVGRFERPIGQLSVTIERCDKSAPGFECLKFVGHSGACECVTTQQFNEAIKLFEDQFLYGTSYALKAADGTLTRLDPTELQIGFQAPATTVVGINMRGGDTLEPADPTDELGKVWDVLHAAGINSGGELSASEGVKLLAGRFTGELMDEYQALQEDFAKLKAREDTARTLLHDASVSLYAKGMSQYEQPRVAMIAWLEE